MFIEPNFIGSKRGWIEVICGSMFSGKTEELIRRLKRAKIAHQKISIFKPSLDTRYHDTEIVSHDTNSVQSVPVSHAKEIIALSETSDVVAIDEAQFFDDDIVDVCNELAKSGKRVIVAGLDMDYLGNPFGAMPQLLAVADYISKLHAICVVCGNIANISYRKTKEQEQIVLGELDVYEPRCRVCVSL